ncbi:MAG: type II toxin-antitoxin system death-on-curing family toxin [Gammaproteobacteria bacterium]|nr:MAG: type II toxin-antitoxin system death-on-curing family toxin [Gammaproteobacteria bacterium]
MKEITWVLDEVVLAVHDEQLAVHGGLSGIRDRGILESALARPRNLAAYEACDDLARLAAAYLYGIVKNHGFVDGNKRTALVTADLFLMLNGYELASSPADNVLMVLSVADGTLSESELAVWLRRNIKVI